MAEINRFLFMRHLRAAPNQFILHHANGKPTRKGAGLAYWFLPLSAAVAQLPVEDCETTFLLQERSLDLQEVSVQCTLAYRVADPEHTAARVNFSISTLTGAWLEKPLERLANFWAGMAQQSARAYLMSVPVMESVQRGAEVIQKAISEALQADAEIKAMGLQLVGVQVIRVAPTAELEKALQTPTRESIQQKADEAVFQRRAMAVEKERAIKENELSTQIELAKQQEGLIAQEASNKMMGVRSESEVEKAKVEATAERNAIAMRAYASETKIRAAGDGEARCITAEAEAAAKRVLAEADADAEAKRVALFATAPAKVLLGLALKDFAGKVETIQHLNLSPDLLGSSLTQFLRDQADQ